MEEMMRKSFRLVVALTGWIAIATVLAPRASHGANQSLPWLEAASVSAVGVAQVRFVNALGSDIAVEADEHLAFADVEFRRTSHYAEVGAQRARFVLRSSDGSEIASVENHLDADGRYTLVAGRD